MIGGQGLSEKVTFEERLKGVNNSDIQRKNIPAKKRANAEALSLE